jgi:hypothetical protein
MFPHVCGDFVRVPKNSRSISGAEGSNYDKNQRSYRGLQRGLI